MFGEKKDGWDKEFGNEKSGDPSPSRDLGHTVLTALMRGGSTQVALPFINPHLHRAAWGSKAGTGCLWALWAGCELGHCCLSVRLEEQAMVQPGLAVSSQNMISETFQLEPSPTWLTPRYLQTFASLVWFSLESPPRGEVWGMNAPAWADLKGRAITDLSPVSSFSSSLPKSTRLLAQSPSWPHDSGCRRHPLLQDLPKYPQKHQRGPKGRNAPLYLCTTPPPPQTSAQH